VSGVSGVAALGVGGAPLDALIRHREAIVGAWQSVGSFAEIPIDNLDHDKNLRRIPPDIRAWVFDQEALCAVRVEPIKSNQGGNIDGCRLLHVELRLKANPPKVSTVPIATLLRPTEAIFCKQLDLVESAADLREDRALEIASQVGPQGAYWETVLNLKPWHHRHTLELALFTLRFANAVAQRMKLQLACKRPVELSTQIQPLIPTPGHGALPSGHANEAFAVATILSALQSADQTGAFDLNPMLLRQAGRIAFNRTVAGLHFPVDHVAGQMLGLCVAEYLLARVGLTKKVDAWTFLGTQFQESSQYDFGEQFEPSLKQRRTTSALPGHLGFSPGNSGQVGVSPLLSWLWNEARKEWQ
jgi:hypothetical protein